MGIVFIFIVFLALFKDPCQAACSVKSCSSAFASRTTPLPPQRPSRPYCVFLREYEECVEGQEKGCFGDIVYHAIKSSLQILQEQNDQCPQILAQEAPIGVSDEALILNAGHLQSHSDPCGYKAGNASDLAHCGMFGDPHLKIFNGSFMTCRVKGAWPLLSSSDLAIQVTNEPVGPDYKATATTKVTVLIKSKEGCSSAKTYEASTDSLPKAFVDGTSWSGIDPSSPSVLVKEASPGNHVLIIIRHINATVGIRRLGRYLTVFTTLPHEVVVASRKSSDLQLCDQGCPLNEQLGGDSQQSFSPAMTEQKALSKCKESNVTDYFLDSCVFDLMTTGDASFREAARLAQKDMWKGDPKSASSFTNCTDWPCLWRANRATTVFSSLRTLNGVLLGCVLVPLLFYRLG